MSWEMVIGLEVHTQLATNSKIFSGAAASSGADPNTQACAVDLGLPGVLPVLNKEAVHKAIILGLGINATINQRSCFARKNYFYPDLPKGYQISQFEPPIVANGHLEVNTASGESKSIRIARAHLEEDAGKSLHEDFHGMTGIDLNRAGTPLLEIVTEPDFRSATEVVSFLKQLHQLVRHLGVSDGNMQEGNFRCDVNLSVCPSGSDTLGTRTECKNLNSFRFVEQAIAYEFERQVQLLESGQAVSQETRLYDPDKQETRTMRDKEDAHDYRYFPDPDLLPIVIDDSWIAEIKTTMPELPATKKQRFLADGLSEGDIETLLSQPELTAFFERVHTKTAQAKLSANWILTELMGRLNKAELPIGESPVSAEQLAELISKIADNTLTSRMAKDVFAILWSQGGNVADIIADQGFEQISDNSELEQIVDQIITEFPEQVAQLQAGKGKVMGFFVGQVMQRTQGKANPQQVNKLFKTKLGNN